MSWLFLLPLLCQDPGVPERQAGILGCSQMPEPRLLLMSEAGAELSFGIFWQTLVYLQGFAKPSLFPVLSALAAAHCRGAGAAFSFCMKICAKPSVHC